MPPITQKKKTFIDKSSLIQKVVAKISHSVHETELSLIFEIPIIQNKTLVKEHFYLSQTIFALFQSWCVQEPGTAQHSEFIHALSRPNC